MKSLRLHPIAFAQSGVMLGSILAIMIWIAVFFANGTFSNDAFADEKVAVEHPQVPDNHQAIIRRLRQHRHFNFKKATLEECTEDISKSLDMKIHFHESTLPIVNRPITFDSKEPISHANALQLVLRRVDLHKCGIVFDNKQLTIVKGEKYSGPTYRIHSMVGRSDISTATREREIDNLLRTVEPRSWSSESQTWIQPGESIFEIDAYQTHSVHETIRKQFHSLRYPPPSIDEDIQKLTFAKYLTDPKERKKVDTEAVIRRLRKKYPFESLSQRLAYEAAKKSDAPPKLSDETKEQLTKADVIFDQARKAKVSLWFVRSDTLRLLHEAEVEAFIARPGAGVSRVQPGPSYLLGSPPRSLPLASDEMIRFRDAAPVNLPATKNEAAARRFFLPSVKSLNQLHTKGQWLFLMPRSFGYIKSREQVAGFLSHGFAVPPPLIKPITRPEHRKDKEIWAMHRLELVSLLKHDKPVVYISRNLPNMEELKKVKTRALNSFEKSALQRLQNGDNVISQASLNRIEMIGSLRASKQCLQCHDVQRGALLCAFSYELLRDPQLDPKQHQHESR